MLVAFGLLLPAASGERSREIKLPPAGGSVRIEGKLRGIDDHRKFIFHGVRGIKVKIELAGAGPLRGVITFPSGRREGGPGGGILDQVLGETGWYRLKVFESTMGEAWAGAFNIKISVAQ